MESHDRKADELEGEADHLETASDSVGEQIKDLREDWEQKKSSEQTAGAVEREAAAPGGLGEEEENGGGDHASEDSG